MTQPNILIVDDEKNIRLTLTKILEPMGYTVKTAVNGEDALTRLAEEEFGLILLDLRMPGMDGLAVLRRVAQLRPDIQVVVVSAYGTVECAVEAIKLGALDFIQKPFAPQEIRDIVARTLNRQRLAETRGAKYQDHLQQAKLAAGRRQFNAALEHAKKAIGLDPARPEAFNLLGALHEIDGNRHQALINYRIALDLDPTYQPARHNLNHLEGDRLNLG
ncbi:MAG: response regulator [Anaerolineae bacterium]